MTVEELKLLTDIKNAIDGIDYHLQGKRDFSLYQQNKTIRRAEPHLQRVDAVSVVEYHG